MRELSTIRRTYFIDGAFIIVPVEELAGPASVHPIASRFLKVGVIERQQFEQARQLVSVHTSLSIGSSNESKTLGGLFSTLVKKRRSRERCNNIFFKNLRR
jgi:hypothetical protein